MPRRSFYDLLSLSRSERRKKRSEEEIEKVVIAYLKKKGFKKTELALQEERNKNPSASQSDPVVAKQILSFSKTQKIESSMMKFDDHLALTDEDYKAIDNIWKQAIPRDFFREESGKINCLKLDGIVSPPHGEVAPMPPIGSLEDFKIMFNGQDLSPYFSKHILSLYWTLCKIKGAHLHEKMKIRTGKVTVNAIFTTVLLAWYVCHSSVNTRDYYFDDWQSKLERLDQDIGMDVSIVQKWLCDRVDELKRNPYCYMGWKAKLLSAQREEGGLSSQDSDSDSETHSQTSSK